MRIQSLDRAIRIFDLFRDSRREILLHQVSLGAPVLNAASGVVGSVSVRLKTEDLETDLVTTAASRLMRTAHQISMDMGYQPMELQSRQLS